jgi:hypothetical protein
MRDSEVAGAVSARESDSAREVGDELAGGLGLHCALEAQRASELSPFSFSCFPFLFFLLFCKMCGHFWTFIKSVT